MRAGGGAKPSPPTPLPLERGVARPPRIERRLNHLVRRKRAGDVRIDLDLHGRMIDLEALGEIAAQLMKKFVAEIAVRHDEMAGERVLGRAHRPDMQVMDANDAGSRRKKASHG